MKYYSIDVYGNISEVCLKEYDKHFFDNMIVFDRSYVYYTKDYSVCYPIGYKEAEDIELKIQEYLNEDRR